MMKILWALESYNEIIQNTQSNPKPTSKFFINYEKLVSLIRLEFYVKSNEDLMGSGILQWGYTAISAVHPIPLRVTGICATNPAWWHCTSPQHPHEIQCRNCLQITNTQIRRLHRKWWICKNIWPSVLFVAPVTPKHSEPMQRRVKFSPPKYLVPICPMKSIHARKSFNPTTYYIDEDYWRRRRTPCNFSGLYGKEWYNISACKEKHMLAV